MLAQSCKAMAHRADRKMVDTDQRNVLPFLDRPNLPSKASGHGKTPMLTRRGAGATGVKIMSPRLSPVASSIFSGRDHSPHPSHIDFALKRRLAESRPGSFRDQRPTSKPRNDAKRHPPSASARNSLRVVNDRHSPKTSVDIWKKSWHARKLYNVHTRMPMWVRCCLSLFYNENSITEI